MATIANLTVKSDGSFEGTLATLNVTAPIAIVPNGRKAKDSEPDYRIVSRKNGFELGAGWKRFSQNTGAEYVSVSLSASESASWLIDPSSPYVVQAGSVIPAALLTGIRSDLPGQITAQVTQNVYDSPTGQTLLIPQGARLIGEYDSEIAAGQSRVLLAWDRLILPGGRSIILDRLPGADAAGMAGLSDRTNHHWGSMLRSAFISTLLGVGAELGADGDDALLRSLREGSQDTINQSGRRLVERQLYVPPTLTIRPGFALRVLVTRDLILEPVAGTPR